VTSPGGAIVDRSLLVGPVQDVAPRLLNLVLAVGGRSGRIVEVEAYGGADDPASHAYGGPTPRNGSMFGAAGLLYVYRSYGLHWCANVVVGTVGAPGAVLVRALEPLEGRQEMSARRPAARRERDLCNGPGKLCAALGIDGTMDGTDLLTPGSPVQLLSTGDAAPLDPVTTSRVGITRAQERPWRFVVPDSPWASRGRLPSGP
jgi:DNA-3-methyladenine glycosylase